MAGMSQLDLALAIGYKSQADISRIERDEQWPDGERLEAIASALGCKVSELFIYAEYAKNDADETIVPHISEQVATYLSDGSDPSLDGALRAVEFELPATDPRTQALLAVEVYKAALGKQNAGRIVNAITGLVQAIEGLKRD